MALKKSQLYGSLWSSCDELRGGMDASQYKDYILTLLFVKYVSDKWAGRSDALIEVPPGGSFADMVKLKGDKEIGEKIDKIIGKLADANDLRNVIDVASFNDDEKLGKGKEMVDRLSKLIGIFEALDFRVNRAEGDDLLGDAYEYLMRHFATEAGKSKGQFYTPAEVSRIMARVVGIGQKTKQDQTIYDPTCGSGSLLLKAADQAPKGMTIYGQEMDNATWALARMNMILHGHATADLRKGNTLASPQFKDRAGKLQTFDFAVANPPFSSKAWTSGLDPEHDEFGRFDYGVPPAKNGDYAFLLHLIKSLRTNGKGAIILPHGVLFRVNKEWDIRQNLVKRGLIKGIIGLPPNLFYGTGIPACIVVIDKENAQARTSLFMIDASRGFVKDGNKNRLRDQDIHKIVDVFNKQTTISGYSRMVSIAEIASPGNDFNLNIPRYIDSSEPEDLQDLDGHLRGGIPNRDIDVLEAYWSVFPSLREQLFAPGDRERYSREKVEAQQVKATILAEPEFKAYSAKVTAVFEAWAAAHTPLLKSIRVGSKPREIIYTLSEDLLDAFANVALLDRYDAYQRLMDYWTETMQDDLYLIAAEGWLDAVKPRLVVEDKVRKLKETPDLVVSGKKYKLDLLPPAFVVGRSFAKEKEAIDALDAKGRKEGTVGYGDGRIFQERRKDGTPKSSRWTISYYVNGHEKRETAATEKAARQLLRKRLTARDAGQIVETEDTRLTVKAMLDTYEAHLGDQGKKSAATIKSHLKPVRAMFNDRRALSLRADDFEQYRKDRLRERELGGEKKPGKSKATVDHELGALRAAYRLSMKQGRLSRVPHIPLFGKSADVPRTGFVERETFDVIAELLWTAAREALADASTFAYLSAWRRGEIFPLPWTQVDRKAREIRLPTSKSGHPRTLPLEGELLALIERRWLARTFETPSGPALAEFVFHEGGVPIGDIRKCWAAACKAAGVPGLRFHDLRRSAIRNMTRSGVPPSIAMSISGHRTISTFLRYDIASEEDKREALRKVEARASAEAGGRSNVVPIGKHGENTENHGSRGKSGSSKPLENMVRPARFERATFSSGG
jgi:type I restriction enzyme M protein